MKYSAFLKNMPIAVVAAAILLVHVNAEMGICTKDPGFCNYAAKVMAMNAPDSAPQFCPANYRVVSGNCIACPANLSNDAGDPTDGGDTACDDGCAENYSVSGGTCVACPANLVNAAGDPINGGDTTCDDGCATGYQNGSSGTCDVCAANFYVKSSACTWCLDGSTNDAGDDFTGAETTCICNCNRYDTTSDTCTTSYCDLETPYPDERCVRPGADGDLGTPVDNTFIILVFNKKYECTKEVSDGLGLGSLVNGENCGDPDSGTSCTAPDDSSILINDQSTWYGVHHDYPGPTYYWAYAGCTQVDTCT